MKKMKDSGIEWIGQIPEDRKLIRSKYALSYIKGRIPTETNTEQNGVPYIGASDLDNLSGRSEYSIYTSDTDIPVCGYEDILVLWDGARAGLIGRNHMGAISSTIVKIIPNDDIDKRFFFWYLKGFEKYLYECVNGTTIPHMNKKYIEDISMLDWSLDDQIRIADFLDEKCSKIDRYIEKQQQIIDKLKAYKQAVITEAVTPKDGWIKCHLGYLAQFKNGLNYNGLSTDNEIKFLGVGDFQNYFTLDSIDMFSTLQFDGNLPEDLLLKNGDIVFVRSNGSKELVGRSILVDKVDYPLTYSGFCIRMRNYRQDIVLNKFLLYRFWNNEFRQNLNRDSRGSNINNLNQELLSKLTIAFPSIDEQVKIVDLLDKKCGEIDTAISKKQSVIDKFTEYKKSLIYEAVTGKLEV